MLEATSEGLTEREQTCVELLPGVSPKSALGKALSYTAGQWVKLTRFLEHPDAPAGDNYLENQIRPFAIGRRSWLFAETQQGARASANLYSLVRCAEVNGLEPNAYMLHLLDELPKAKFRTSATSNASPWASSFSAAAAQLSVSFLRVSASFPRAGSRTVPV